MREPPLAVGPQRLLQRGQPAQVVEVGQGARLGQGTVVGQAGQQLAEARHEHDPGGVLTPGYEVF